MMRIIFAAAAAFALAACAQPSEPTLWLLPPEPMAADATSTRGAVAVAEIALPDYADATGVATLAADGAVTVSNNDAWGDPLSRAATRRLSHGLSRRLQRVVLAEPWPLEFSPSARVDVVVDRFVGALGGSVELAGEYRIADGRGLRAVRRFAITQTSDGADVAALVIAHAAAIDALAAQIAEAL